MKIDRSRPWLALPVAFAMILSLCGCNSKPQLGNLMDAFGQPKTEASAEVWDEHTVGLPFLYGYDEGLAKAQAEGRPAMIFLTTTWCKWCKRMSATCLQDPEIRGLLEQNFVLVLVDGDQESAVKRKLKNTGYPHIVFISPDEQILASQNGYAEPDAFKQVIAQALAAQ
ncbi:Disulfide bond reductase DsbH precursor [Rosistilla carotiformis]|uniref:Disulfide bond reductase DsbH n=1 Tax=Rosistilla carotiformis TaxID=2528017 RepID=A0A518JXQ4_9BACT|nr:thioredoxin family protein [Rosistilla carotiformis]QDV70324.1 Disulfide bond reductase DsbH precursor [Rosistilla carotiformis]